MKIIRALLCFFLLAFVSSQAAIIEVAPVDAFSPAFIGSGQTVAAAGGCATQTAGASETRTIDGNVNYVGAAQEYVLQGFQTSTAGDLYSIKMYLDSTGTDDTITVRFGTTNDLSTGNYLEQTTAIVSSVATYEFVFDSSRQTLSTGVTYYIAWTSDAADYDDRTTSYSNNSGTITGGDYDYGAAAIDWGGSGAWTDGGNGTDLNIQVMICD